jgi:hypothetical protein
MDTSNVCYFQHTAFEVVIASRGHARQRRRRLGTCEELAYLRQRVRIGMR